MAVGSGKGRAARQGSQELETPVKCALERPKVDESMHRSLLQLDILTVSNARQGVSAPKDLVWGRDSPVEVACASETGLGQAARLSPPLPNQTTPCAREIGIRKDAGDRKSVV